LLATREHVWIGVGVVADAQLLQQRQGAAFSLPRGLSFQAEGHVLQHREMRKQRRILKGQTDIALLGWQVPPERYHRTLAIEGDVSLLKDLEPCGDSQQRRLAAPRRPEQADQFPGGHIQVDAPYGIETTEGVMDTLHRQHTWLRGSGAWGVQGRDFAGHEIAPTGCAEV